MDGQSVYNANQVNGALTNYEEVIKNGVNGKISKLIYRCTIEYDFSTRNPPIYSTEAILKLPISFREITMVNVTVKSLYSQTPVFWYVLSNDATLGGEVIPLKLFSIYPYKGKCDVYINVEGILA